MKKVIAPLILACLVCIASCKNDTSLTTAGSWVFKTNTYAAATAFSPAPGIIEADNALIANTTTYATLRCYFSGTNPTSSGTYHVIKYGSGAVLSGQVSLQETINGISGTSYSSTGGNGSETITVTVASNGFITISGIAVEMLSSGSDSDVLTLNITQIQ